MNTVVYEEKTSYSAESFPNKITTAGSHLLRYGLVLVLLWIGGMKFTAYEAQGIKGFVENSPFMSWAYSFLSFRAFSSLIGVTEIAIALLIGLRPISARLAAIGSFLAVGTFLSTLSFLVTTPGIWEPTLGGFPALSITGQFIIKDVALLGIALWSFGEAWQHIRKS